MKIAQLRLGLILNLFLHLWVLLVDYILPFVFRYVVLHPVFSFELTRICTAFYSC